MDAAAGGVLVESISTSMGVVLGLMVDGNGFITLGGGMVFAVERVFLADGVVDGGLLVAGLSLGLVCEESVLRVDLVGVLSCLGGRAMEMC